MQWSFFEHAYILQSLGWSIVNSFWQVGCLWLFYQCITNIDKKIPAPIKYCLSLCLLLTAFILFLFTFIRTYLALSNGISYILTGNASVSMPVILQNSFTYLSLIYLVFLGFYIIQFFKNLSGNYLIQRHGLIKPPAGLRFFTTNTALHLGLNRKIQIWLSVHVSVPSITGYFKPVILLPAAILSHLSIAQIEAIILHELEHIKRNDYLVNILQSVIGLTLFFNPFAILLGKIAKKERENCCDDRVMAFQYNRYEYAKALLILEEQRNPVHLKFALTATSGKKDLLNRVKRLFNEQPQNLFSTRRTFSLITICVAVVTVFFTIIPLSFISQGNIKVSDTESAGVIVKTSEKLYTENHIKTISSTDIVKSSIAKPRLPLKGIFKEPPHSESDQVYINAAINEELLKNNINPVEPILTRVADTEIDNTKYLVIIEEEESGKKPIVTYYFELKNKDGNAAVKPLIILNKLNVPGKNLKKSTEPRLSDSLGVSQKITTKRKVTS